jgi:predicted negative regulator of RcsB-dependent stress response
MSKKDTNIEFEEINGAGAPAIEANGIESLQHFFEKNKNMLLGGLILFLVVVIGGYYYQNIYMPEAEMSANNEMFAAQYLFEKDSFALALNTEGGFLDVIDNHGSTNAANLAQYYAGLCYFNLANYPEAIGHLSSYKTKDEILGAMALGVLGDAQMENGEVDAALASYKIAANFSENEASAPYLLKKAGIAFENNGNNKQAFDFYTKIKTTFPSSELARDIEKYIGRVEAQL